MQIASNLDAICFNMYDGYFNPQIALDTRLSWTSIPSQSKFSLTLNAFGAIRFAMQAANLENRPFWVTESGWATQGNIPGSTVQNLQTFYDNFYSFDMNSKFYPQQSNVMVSPPERIFYFTIRDVPNEDNYYGLYYNKTSLDPKF